MNKCLICSLEFEGATCPACGEASFEVCEVECCDPAPAKKKSSKKRASKKASSR